MTSFSSEYLRINPLTGCKNYLGFLETLVYELYGLTEEEIRIVES
jgi:hypothetical protein